MQSSTTAARQRVTTLRKVDMFLLIDGSPSIPALPGDIRVNHQGPKAIPVPAKSSDHDFETPICCRMNP
jgi:hypothetical protein